MAKRIILFIIIILAIVIAIFSLLNIFGIKNGKLYLNDDNDTSFSEEKINESNLILMISNQSFENPTVKIKGNLDNKVIFNDKFEVGNQHLASYYYFNLEQGEYNLYLESEDDAVLEETITIGEYPLWVYSTYWKDKESGPNLDAFKQNKPIFLD